MLQKCVEVGHEIASHGYGYVLAYEVGQKAFAEDIYKGKAILEDISGKDVIGFRAAGFSTKDDIKWAFDVITRVGHKYDSSICSRCSWL